MNAIGFEQVLPQLYRWQSFLTGPQHPVNSYVWSRNDSTILIDPAADLSPSRLAPLKAASVTDILVTHVQEENLAGCFNFPAARVHVPAGDEYLCQGRDAYEKLITNWQPPWDWEGRGNYLGHIGGARNERPAARPLPLAESLRPGQSLLGFAILATPGHGKHAVTLQAEIAGQRVAFCGDLICGDGKLWNWFDSEWDFGLEMGQRTLMQSAARLGNVGSSCLCPAHGTVNRDPRASLKRLIANLHPILDNETVHGNDAARRLVSDLPKAGHRFRPLLPALHQYMPDSGNCAVLLSTTGNALLVDDGLCYWQPMPERVAHHRAVIADLKRDLGIRRIEWVIPTHYHGDHIENIPDLVSMEGSKVVCLDIVADAIEHPERHNLICPLPWYETGRDTVKVDQRVSKGKILRWHEYNLEIFHLGGQTYYHAGITVDVGGQRVLFVGDSMGGLERVCEPVHCYNDCEPVTRGWSYGIERMIEQRPDLLVCGHAVAVRDPMPLLQERRKAWQRRIQEFKALSAKPDLRDFFDPFCK